MPLSAVDSVSPALRHTTQQLFRPFQLGQWTRVALVGLFAGELSTGKACNFHSLSQTSSAHHHVGMGPHWGMLGPALALLLLALPLVLLFFIYLNSRMRFVLFDTVVTKRCEVARYWRQRSRPAMQYFVWQLFLVIITMASIGLLIGVPLLTAVLRGWIKAPHSHMPAIILTGVGVFCLFALWVLALIVVHVFTKDFVVPQMALEDISALEGWRRLWPMLERDAGSYARYGVMKVVMTIAAAIAVGILTAIVTIFLLIPFGGVSVIAILFGKAAGLTWNAFTITAAIVVGSVFLLAILYVLSLISVPVIIFFPAYSIYFFASRFSPLATLLYPPPPMPPIAPVTAVP